MDKTVRWDFFTKFSTNFSFVIFLSIVCSFGEVYNLPVLWSHIGSISRVFWRLIGNFFVTLLQASCSFRCLDRCSRTIDRSTDGKQEVEEKATERQLDLLWCSYLRPSASIALDELKSIVICTVDDASNRHRLSEIFLISWHRSPLPPLRRLYGTCTAFDVCVPPDLYLRYNCGF